ncbi:hypothetical protein LXA43DRAFT_1136928 [Ganoderma leucocontextum]|nr:hypothetical protein LXA43DRAFT_1136928 [Ganoderma leucocontextum]
MAVYPTSYCQLPPSDQTRLGRHVCRIAAAAEMISQWILCQCKSVNYGRADKGFICIGQGRTSRLARKQFTSLLSLTTSGNLMLPLGGGQRPLRTRILRVNEEGVGSIWTRSHTVHATRSLNGCLPRRKTGEAAARIPSLEISYQTNACGVIPPARDFLYTLCARDSKYRQVYTQARQRVHRCAERWDLAQCARGPSVLIVLDYFQTRRPGGWGNRCTRHGDCNSPMCLAAYELRRALALHGGVRYNGTLRVHYSQAFGPESWARVSILQLPSAQRHHHPQTPTCKPPMFLAVDAQPPHMLGAARALLHGLLQPAGNFSNASHASVLLQSTVSSAVFAGICPSRVETYPGSQGPPGAHRDNMRAASILVPDALGAGPSISLVVSQCLVNRPAIARWGGGIAMDSSQFAIAFVSNFGYETGSLISTYASLRSKRPLAPAIPLHGSPRPAT